MTSMMPRGRTFFPGLIDWMDNPWPFQRNLVRIEETVQDDRYIVRAELPGFDPKEHIHVTTEGNLLTISAERESRLKESGQSEFRYGSFSRTVSLPEGADAAKIAATYTDGILEVTVPIARREPNKPVQIKVTAE